jgi:hypothetical protein
MTSEHYHDLAVRFVKEILKVQLRETTDEGWTRATTAYFEALAPWVELSDLPTPPRMPFVLFEHLTFEHEGEEDESVTVTLSPEGQLFFLAWLRRKGIDPNSIEKSSDN